MRTGLSTNVTLLRDQMSERLAALPLDILLLSVDGISAPAYERIRVRGDFARVLDNVMRFATAWERQSETERPRHVALSFIDLPCLHEEINNAQAFWKDRLPRAFVINRKPFHPWGYQDPLTRDIARAVGDTRVPVRRRRRCHEFSRGLVILSDGRCVPCCNDYEARLVVGNLRHQTLAEVWNGPILQQLRTDTELDNDLCRFCPAYTPTPEDAMLDVSPFQPWNELGGYLTISTS